MLKVGAAKNLAKFQANARNFPGPNPNFPGQNDGIPRGEIIREVLDAPKVQGIQFTSAAGDLNPAFNLPSTAREIIGISFNGAVADTDTFDMIINNEQVITSAGVRPFNVNNGTGNSPYYEFQRFVAGSTSLELVYTSIAGGVVVTFNVWYR